MNDRKVSVTSFGFSSSIILSLFISSSSLRAKSPIYHLSSCGRVTSDLGQGGLLKPELHQKKNPQNKRANLSKFWDFAVSYVETGSIFCWI